jgi:hypothetical protein
MPIDYHARDRARINSQRPCSVQGCTKRRHSLSKWCAGHEETAAKYGHVYGHRIPAGTLRPYKKLAARWLARHASNPSVQAAIAEMRDILWVDVSPPTKKLGHKGVNFHERYQAWRELRRLADAGVKPEDALIICLATWMLSMWREPILPDDARLTMALGRHVLKLATLRGRVGCDANFNRKRITYDPPTQAVRYVGRTVRTRLGLFLAQVTLLIAQELRAKEDAAEARRTALRNVAGSFNEDVSAANTLAATA